MRTSVSGSDSGRRERALLRRRHFVQRPGQDSGGRYQTIIRGMTADATRQALERFYDALANRDAETLAGMYAPDATFEDPVFDLRGPEIGRMGKSLLGRARDLS